MSAVVDRIRAEIERRGPIPFADFMAMAVAGEDGFYASAADRPTRSGDFLTAPELHPIFGAALSRHLAAAWERLGRPSPFTLLEYGAGSGTLALTIAAGLRADASPLAGALRFAPVELNPHRRAELEVRAAAVGLAVVDPAGADRAPIIGAILANEFLDALPVHVVEVRHGRILEAHVAVAPDGGFIEVLREPGTPAVARRLHALAASGATLAEGQRAELCLALDDWAAEVGRRLDRGIVVAIDYGAPAAELYGARRRAGTLMTYHRHAADGSPGAPFRDVGDRDITAHVDTTTLIRLLEERDLALLAETTLARYLVSCGLEDLLRREQAALVDMAAGLLLRSSVARLLDPRHLGAFRVVMAGRGLADPSLPIPLDG